MILHGRRTYAGIAVPGRTFGVAIRALSRDEIEVIWTIDRSEVHHHIYNVVDGSLTLVPAYFEIPGWHPRMIESDRPRLYECFDRRGIFLGSFDGDTLIGVSVVDTKPVGSRGDHVQLRGDRLAAASAQGRRSRDIPERRRSRPFSTQPLSSGDNGLPRLCRNRDYDPPSEQVQVDAPSASEGQLALALAGRT